MAQILNYYLKHSQTYKYVLEQPPAPTKLKKYIAYITCTLAYITIAAEAECLFRYAMYATVVA